MEKPRTTTDLRIALPCPSCFGLGRTGQTDCAYCSASGWLLKDPAKLSPAELERLRKKLPQSTTTDSNVQPQ